VSNLKSYIYDVEEVLDRDLNGDDQIADESIDKSGNSC